MVNESFQANRNVLFTEVDDGQAVLLHLETKFYYTLNKTGVVVWKTLSDVSATRRRLAETLSERFIVDVDEAARDLEPVLDEMLSEGLILRGS
jgi:hypothetical protein